MIPFYIFYSMFGFQRTGDLMWAAGDAMARGFLLGATAGRTTLNGEGLQHEDGHSHVISSTVPACVSYDITFAYELAAIIEDGMRRMFAEDENIYYYITLQNENYVMPAMPQGAKEGILRGLYRYKAAAKKTKTRVQLFGSGSIMNEVLRAQELLREKFNRGGRCVERHQLHRAAAGRLGLRTQEPAESRRTSRNPVHQPSASGRVRAVRGCQ